MDQGAWEGFGTILGALGAAVSALWGAAKWLRPRYLAWRRRQLEREEATAAALALVEPMSRQVEGVVLQLDSLYREMHPNGGGSLRDAINQIRRSQEVHTAEQRILLDANPDAVFKTDPQGRITWVNRTYCRMTGRSRDEFAGYNALNTVDPRDRRRVAAELADAVLHGREFQASYRLLGPDGTAVPVRSRATPVLDEKGVVLSYLGVVIRDPEELP
jgi:PAS domain S-box-containing protein